MAAAPVGGTLTMEVTGMRLTLKDAFGTLLVLVGLAFAYSVVAGWGWPLMNGVRAGIIALGVASFIACPVSWRTSEPNYFKSPFFIVGAIVGVFVLGLLVSGLIVGTLIYLELMMGGVALLWLITTLHHMLPETGARPATAA